MMTCKACTPMPPTNEIIIGVDPGFGRCGYGVIVMTLQGIRFISAGCIETSAMGTHPARLGHIHDALTRVVRETKPSTFSIEKLFFAQNTSTALGVAESRGVALLVAHTHTIPVREFTPLEVKMAMTGYGRATKPQVKSMVSRILGLSKLPASDDAIDALAIA